MLGESKPENTGLRPSEYSAWHRTLGDGCYAIDIDFVEYREGRGIVAFMGVTGRLKDENHIHNSMDMIWKRTHIERKIMQNCAEKVGAPAFLVVHTTDLSVFFVFRLDTFDRIFTKMNKDEYTKFIKEL